MSTYIVYDIRPPSPADVPAIARINISALDASIPGQTFSDKPNYSLPELEKAFPQLLFPEDGGMRTSVALHPGTGEVVRYVIVKERRGSLPEGLEKRSDVQVPEDAPMLDRLFTVVPKDGGDGKGVGTALMRRVLAEERWVKTGISVFCFERNLRALRFYEKWGFEQIGRTVNDSAADEDKFLLLWRKSEDRIADQQ